jgi:hypothetical protein
VVKLLQICVHAFEGCFMYVMYVVLFRYTLIEEFNMLNQELCFKHDSLKDLHDLLYKVLKFGMSMAVEHNESMAILLLRCILNLIRNYKENLYKSKCPLF